MTETRLAIHREALLAAEHLALGATMIGKANYAYQSRYYEAFFALSVGFERSAKLAIAIDEYLNSGKFPSEKALRTHGHKISSLLHFIDEIARNRGLTDPWSFFPSTEIHNGIVSVLSEFASNITRYYNLDIITNSDRVHNVEDPLKSWHRKVFIPVSAKHYSKRVRKRVEMNAKFIGDVFGDMMLARHVSETGDSLNDVSSASALTGHTRAVQPYVRMYIMQIARFMYSVMSQLGYAAQNQHCTDVPYLAEYYSIFCNEDKYFRNKKIWSIHPE